jgi:hypothetical protein
MMLLLPHYQVAAVALVILVLLTGLFFLPGRDRNRVGGSFRLFSLIVGVLLLVLSCPLLLYLVYGFYLHLIFGSFESRSSEQAPVGEVQAVALADLNGSGYLDAYLAVGGGSSSFYNYSRPDRILFNDGHGRFSDSQQELSTWRTSSVVLGDVNDDGQVDILISPGPGLRLHLNDGHGRFDRGSFALPDSAAVSTSLNAALADLNGNGRLDVVACCGIRVWLNEGHGYFPRTHQTLPLSGRATVALGDLNGNGFPDAFIAAAGSANEDGSREGTANSVWINDGQGRFNDSSQRLGQKESTAVVLGDLNGNGFPDAVVGNDGADEIWFNDGAGSFSNSRQRLGNGRTRALFLADLNGNSRLDLVISSTTSAQVWLNDGAGRFEVGQQIDYEADEAIAVGDVTGDGIVDLFVAGVEWYQVWRGMGNGRFTADPRTNFPRGI